MKTTSYLSFCILAILNTQSTYGYVANPPLYGRTFDLFNFFPFVDKSYATLSSKISALDSSTTSANSQISKLLNLVQSMTLTIQSLQAQISAPPSPTCSSTAPSTAKIVSGKCYLVFTNALSFAAAKDVCISGGGKLAEPLAADALALWTALQTAFPVATGIIGAAPANTGVWLGFTQGAGVANAQVPTTAFTALSNPGVTVATTSFRIGPVVGAVGFNNAAVLDTPTPVVATPFISLDSALLTNTRPFICQY